MKIGVSLLFLLSKPFSFALKYLRNVNVNYVEIVDEGLHTLNKRRVEYLRRLGRSNQLEFTVHAPFADINIASPNRTLRHVMMKRLEKSIVYASQLQCRQWIFHPGWKTGISAFYPDLDWQINLRSVRHLLAFGKKHDLPISIENGPEPFAFLLKTIHDFARFYDDLGAEIGLTLDIAHANTTSQTLNFIDNFQHRIVHIHVSDNEGKYDSHVGIGNGEINWKAVAESLKRVKYRDLVMLESIERVDESIQLLLGYFK